jgi:hypothetical protein
LPLFSLLITLPPCWRRYCRFSPFSPLRLAISPPLADAADYADIELISSPASHWCCHTPLRRRH